MRKVVKSKKAPRPRGPYSPAIVSGGFVFVAGQAILEAAGSSMQDVVRCGVFLSDMKNFAAMNEVYAKYFPKNPPARTTVGVSMPKIKVEIDCIARVSKSRKRK